MKKETLKRIFDFLEKKENKNPPFKWKLIFNEPLTKEELTIDGDLDLAFSQITSLPEGLEVKGNLDLSSTNITSLPEGLFVWGNLSLSDCKKITRLPEGLKVELNLYIGDTLLQRYEDEDLIEMVKPSDDINGYIKGKISRNW